MAVFVFLLGSCHRSVDVHCDGFKVQLRIG